MHHLGPGLLERPEKLKGYVAITNISTHPLTFRVILIPSKNMKVGLPQI